MKTHKPKHTSMNMVGRTGQPAPSWTPAPELTALANECFRALVSPYAKPDLIRVFLNDPTVCRGRCFVEQRIITIARSLCDPLPTLAHEIAHLRVLAHCPKHEKLTAELLVWLRQRTEVKA